MGTVLEVQGIASFGQNKVSAFMEQFLFSTEERQTINKDQINTCCAVYSVEISGESHYEVM